MEDKWKNTQEHSAEFINSLARYSHVKEEHAVKAKEEVRIIWGDYMKPEIVAKYPQVHELVHKIMALASKSKQTVKRETAVELVEAINQFAEIFWDSKGIKTKRAKAPYAPNLELVYPAL